MITLPSSSISSSSSSSLTVVTEAVPRPSSFPSSASTLPSSSSPRSFLPLSPTTPQRSLLPKKKKQPLFQTSTPVVRVTADTTLQRPPRLTYGYCCVSGSHRDYSIGSQNMAMDRLMYIDNYTGNNEMALFGGIEGIGFNGYRICQWLTQRLPDLVSEIAVTTAKTKKRQQQDEALALVESKATLPPEQASKAGKGPMPSTSVPSITYKEKLQQNAFDKVKFTAKQLLKTIDKERKNPLTNTHNDITTTESLSPSLPTLSKRTDKPTKSSSFSTPTPTHPYIISRPGTRIFYSTGPDTIHDIGIQKNGPEPLTKVQLRMTEILQDTLKAAHHELKAQNDQYINDNRQNLSASPNPLDATASGASVCLCVIKGRTLAIAHLGAVRAVLGRTVDVLTLRSTLEKVKDLAHENILAATINSKSAATTLNSANTVSSTTVHHPSSSSDHHHHHLPSSSSTLPPPSTKYSRVSAAARMAKLTYDIGAVNVSNPYGTVKPLVPVPSSSSSSSSPSHTVQPINPLVTTSIPNFPDIPAVLENVLHHPETTYRKPSQILTLQRRHLVQSIQNTTMNGTGASAPTATENNTTVRNTQTNGTDTLPPDPYSTNDRKEKQRLYEQIEIQELTSKVQGAVFDLRGRLVPKLKHAITSSSHSTPMLTDGTLELPNDISSPVASSSSSLTANLPSSPSSHYHHVHDDKDADDNVSTAPVDFSIVPKEYTHTELGQAVYQKYSSHRNSTTAASHSSSTISASLPPSSTATSTLSSSSSPSSSLPVDDNLATALQDAKYYDDKGQPLGIPIAVPLTIDHRPDRPDERTRIYHHGGRVECGIFSDGSKGSLPRIYGMNNDGPGLATSRTLGYFCGSSLGISTEPELTVRLLDKEDRFIIIASDGIWSVLSNDEAVRIVARCCESILYGGTGQAKKHRTPQPLPTKNKKGKEKDDAADRDDDLVQTTSEDTDHDNESTPSSRDQQSTILLSAMGSAKDTIYTNRHTSSTTTATAADILAITSSLPSTVPSDTSTFIQNEYIPSALTTSALPLYTHPASLAVAALPSLGSKPSVPLLQHPIPQIHIAPTSGTEMRLSICAGPAPVVGGGGSGVDVPTDLLESVIPTDERVARQNRLRRVAAACAEAVVAAAKKRWMTYTGKKLQQKKNVRIWGNSIVNDIHGVYDDLSCLVVLLDHVKK